jgi:hypothetical protein
MAFSTDSIEITPELEFASNAYLASSASIFTEESVEIEPNIELASGSYVALGSRVFTQSSIEIDPDSLIGMSSGVYISGTGAGGGLRIFSNSIIIEPFVLPPAGTPSANFTQGIEFGFFITDPIIPVIVSPRNGGYEVIYPVVPSHSVDVIINQTDAVLWRRLQLTANRTFDTIRFKIRRETFDTMISFFDRNLNGLIELYLPGIRPFGNNFVRSYVRILNYNSSFLEYENVFRLDVMFQFVEGIA